MAAVLDYHRVPLLQKKRQWSCGVVGLLMSDNRWSVRQPFRQKAFTVAKLADEVPEGTLRDTYHRLAQAYESLAKQDENLTHRLPNFFQRDVRLPDISPSPELSPFELALEASRR
jgi:hypothetical protein